jgi:hypothetical protein
LYTYVKTNDSSDLRRVAYIEAVPEVSTGEGNRHRRAGKQTIEEVI